MASVGLYKTYSFVDKDPIIDEMRSVLEAEQMSYAQVETLTNVSVATMYNWFNGKTRRPQNATVKAFLRGLGYDYQVTKNGKVVSFSPSPRKPRHGK